MKRIDHDTARKILDAADIVEVVSDFVKLKRSGANYKGLCPFHNERTPSFSVNRARNMCKCFSCGKGGSPVNFIMELEHLSYQEALRYLAKKYNIEIVEHEMSQAERQAENDRQGMFAINEFAQQQFEHNLTETDDGRNIGLSYLQHRGINDAMIKRFHLGYALERESLTKFAIEQGYSEKYLLDTGLSVKSDRDGSLYDRFRGRVIFPVHTLSGRVVAFGGRTLRSDKNVAKYVNSPESIIYSKSHELYGLFQAKSAISRADKCILVEGYMDVISMHQAGIENVVASSGTSLTEGQIKMIQRFTRNVTVIYDSDAAGIKASLRGIDMLLRADLDIKVLSLPDGDDPDTFAQSHSATEVEAYIADHEEDFISFKTRILLADSGDDPIKRAKVINSVLESIAVIPQEVKRVIYLGICSKLLDVAEDVLARQLNVIIARNADEAQRNQARRRAEQSLGDLSSTQGSTAMAADNTATGQTTASTTITATATPAVVSRKSANPLEPHEREVMRYVLRYGFYAFCDELVGEDEEVVPLTVYEYVTRELSSDQITLTNPVYAHVLERVGQLWNDPERLTDFARNREECLAMRHEHLQQGIAEIRDAAGNVGDIEAREKQLTERCDAEYYEAVADYTADYLQRILMSDADDVCRNLSTELTTDRHQLSKMHTKYARIETERERLADLVNRAILELKNKIIEQKIGELQRKLLDANMPTEEQMDIVEQIERFQDLRKTVAKILGERIISPVKL